MAGTSPAMTAERSATLATKPLAKHLFQDLSLDVLVGERSIVPPPAVALHLFGRRDKAIRHLAEIRVGVVEAEDQPAGSDPAQRQACRTLGFSMFPPFLYIIPLVLQICMSVGKCRPKCDHADRTYNDR